MVPRFSSSITTEGGQPGQMSPLRMTLPQHAQDFTCAAKQTGREERCFLGTPMPRAMPSKTGKRKSGQVFPSRKTLSSTHKISRAPQNHRNKEHCFIGPPLPRPMPSKTGKGKTGQVFSVKEKLFQIRTTFHVRRKKTVTRETLFSVSYTHLTLPTKA